MKITGIIFILLFTFFTNRVSAQLELINNIDKKADKVYIDKLNNFYFVSGSNIKKTDKNFNLTAEYSNNFLGKIKTMDVSNPLRILVFFKENNKFVYLDNYLSELRSPISLDNLGLNDVSAICNSSAGGFWVYRNNLARLYQYSQSLNKSQAGTDLSSFGANSPAKKIIETSKHIIIWMSDNQVFITDRFGTFNKKIALGDTEILKFNDNTLYSYNSNIIRAINIHTEKEKKHIVLLNNIKDFAVKNNEFHILTDSSLKTYIAK